MSEVDKDEGAVFEIALAIPKWGENKWHDCLEVLVDELRKKGLILERVVGFQSQFIKLAAPVGVLGKAAAELKFRKRTRIGLDFPFEWDEAKAFARLPDGDLFSWCERYRCYNHIVYGIVNEEKSIKVLKSDYEDIQWKPGESLIRLLEVTGAIKEVFPLHDEKKRKQLLRSWAMNWLDFTSQPIDDICLYYGMKIATYFAFLGMYTKWMLFPAALGLVVQLVDFGLLQLLVLPVFFICLISWSVLFFQFWKRKSSALSARLKTYHLAGAHSQTEHSLLRFPIELLRKQSSDRMKEKANFQREEWLRWLMRLRNDMIIIMSIICLQLPFELAYAHLFEVLRSDLLKFFLTAVYLFTIQYLTRMGGKISVKLIKYEDNETVEYRANSLVYKVAKRKVFGLYFMQSYIGIFYHALLHRNIKTLRQVLIQRLIVYEVIGNLLENSIPYLSYSFKKFKAVRNKWKHERGSSNVKTRLIPRVEKDYLKPAYAASIGQEIEDGLFDDFLELVLQFGMIMMFACAFPLAFAFAAVSNVTEIRADALKLLATMRRPIPRADATIGAWLNIFQFLIVISICTNSALLVCLYDQEGSWSLSPGLTWILVMEHVLLFIKFGFSRLVPEEPAWVKAIRRENATQAEQICSKQFLRSISGDEKLLKRTVKNE